MIAVTDATSIPRVVRVSNLHKVRQAKWPAVLFAPARWRRRRLPT
jgi:hypothetical protein